MEKITAVVLAAGSGRRMNSEVPKQYMMLADHPVLYYALHAFEESEVSEIVVVTGADEIEYCHREIVERYGFGKVRAIVEGGKERCHSVYAGLVAVQDADYVLIHDGARPFVTAEIIRNSLVCVRRERACIVGMPVKDTVKVVDEGGIVRETPDRSTLWQVQTPQTFDYGMIREAYEKMMRQSAIQVTDDAMVLEQMTGHPVRVIEGSYRNIKITTPEDLLIAEAYLKQV